MTNCLVSVLPMDEGHLSQVATIEKLCFFEPWSEQSLRLLLGDGGIGMVVVDSGVVVAYGGMTYVLDEGSVTNIAVHPEYRRRGYGRRVTEALLHRAGSLGVKSVFLEVRESNQAAIALYQSEGFIPCGVRKNFYRHPVESALLMAFREGDTEENNL